MRSYYDRPDRSPFVTSQEPSEVPIRTLLGISDVQDLLSWHEDLTPRELEILATLDTYPRRKSRELARRLHIEPKTFNKHMSNIEGKASRIDAPKFSVVYPFRLLRWLVESQSDHGSRNQEDAYEVQVH